MPRCKGEIEPGWRCYNPVGPHTKDGYCYRCGPRAEARRSDQALKRKLGQRVLEHGFQSTQTLSEVLRLAGYPRGPILRDVE